MGRTHKQKQLLMVKYIAARMINRVDRKDLFGTFSQTCIKNWSGGQ